MTYFDKLSHTLSRPLTLSYPTLDQTRSFIPEAPSKIEVTAYRANSFSIHESSLGHTIPPSSFQSNEANGVQTLYINASSEETYYFTINLQPGYYKFSLTLLEAIDWQAAGTGANIWLNDNQPLFVDGLKINSSGSIRLESDNIDSSSIFWAQARGEHEFYIHPSFFPDNFDEIFQLRLQIEVAPEADPSSFSYLTSPRPTNSQNLTENYNRWNYEAPLGSSHVILYSFAELVDDIPLYARNRIDHRFTQYADEHKASIRSALQDIEDEFGLKFLENPSDSGLKSTFIFGARSGGGGYAYYPNLGEFTSLILLGIDDGFTLRERSYTTLLHEIGHALGLLHTFDGEETPEEYDNDYYSLMSYTEAMNFYPTFYSQIDEYALHKLYGYSQEGVVEIIDGTLTTSFGSEDNLSSGNVNSEIIFAGDGNDRIFSDLGNDIVHGENGSDELNGQRGNDTLYGDAARALITDSFEAQIYRAYVAVLGREPDAAGLQAYLDAMRLDILDQGGMVAEFVASAEFQATYGDLNNTAFIQQLYRNVFDREADAGGLEAYRSALDSGALSRTDVVLELANSAEFLQLTTLGTAAFGSSVALDPAEGGVFRIYQAVFGRDPDLAGFETYVNSVQGSFLTLADIAVEFVASDEFQATYGALSNADFVELLYANVLPGNTDQQGRNNYTESLDSGALTRTDMVLEFVESFEFITATHDDAMAFRNRVFLENSDFLDGGLGDDVLFGGRGADTFVYDVSEDEYDTILDYTIGTDNIQLRSEGESFDTFAEIIAVATQDGNDTLFNFGNGQILRLKNVRIDDLIAEDFGLNDAVSSTQKPADTAPLIYEREETNTDLTSGLDNDFDTPLADYAPTDPAHAELRMDLWLNHQYQAFDIDSYMQDALI